MNILQLQSILSTAWVVWFFILFGGILVFVLRPSKRAYYASQADIPLRDDRPAASRSRRAAGPERESGRQTPRRSI